MMRIVIDVVNTILFHKPSISMLYSFVLAKYGYAITPDKIIEARNKVLIERRFYDSICTCNNSEATYRERWISLTLLILNECGINNHMADKIANEIHSRINDEKAIIVTEPSIISILEILRKQQHSIGALSNGYSSIKSWLSTLKLDKYFDFILISSDIGHLKPCPFAFSKALKDCIKTENTISVFVGDDLYEDGFGAIHGGFDAAIIIGSNSIIVQNERIKYISKLGLIHKALKEVEEICINR